MRKNGGKLGEIAVPNSANIHYSLRVVENWNKLPADIENCHSVNIFKNFINKVWKNHPVKFSLSCYGPEVDNIDTSNQKGSPEAEA